MTSQPLPPPRTLLTKLINSLSQLSPIDPPPPTTTTTTRTTNTNPFKNLPPSSRDLLTSLHVLLPDILLKSLDLLDRGLVTKVILEESLGEAPASQLDTGTNNDSNGNDNDKDIPVKPPTPTIIHLVKSSQPGPYPRSRQPDFSASTSAGISNTTGGAGAGGRIYIVRTAAWNCSCEAFAFSAFPSGSSSGVWRGEERRRSGIGGSERLNVGMQMQIQMQMFGGERKDGHEYHDENEERKKREEEEQQQPWQFGALSKENGGGSVPCCKHLLACVLAERWKGVLGEFVKIRRVGREEMAGLVGGA